MSRSHCRRSPPPATTARCCASTVKARCTANRSELDGTSVGLAQLQDIDDPYRLTLNARAGRTSVKFDGTIVPADTENLRGTLRLQGPDLSKLYPIVPAPLPGRLPTLSPGS